MEKPRIEFRYYVMPGGEYVLPKLGEVWEQEYGKGMGSMLHFHNYMEIGYCYHGAGTMIIEDREYRYGGEMFTMLPAKMPHTTISDPGHICKWEFLFIDIDEFIRNEMKDEIGNVDDVIRIINKRGTLKSMENHRPMGETVLSIIRECREHRPYYKETVNAYLRALVYEALRLDEERESIRRRHQNVRYIDQALNYVDEHFAEEIKIRDLAEACSLSESHFRRIFEQIMSMKPMDYVNMIRIQKACHLIAHKNYSMQEVCYRVGYQTASTFNRNFKQLTGMTPYQWKSARKTGEMQLSDFKITAMKGWEGVDTLGAQILKERDENQ